MPKDLSPLDAAAGGETPIELRRIDPARNMRRFYRLWIAPDLFGGFLLMKHWGRLGATRPNSGRVMAERYADAGTAAEALRRRVARKVRRGYAS